MFVVSLNIYHVEDTEEFVDPYVAADTLGRRKASRTVGQFDNLADAIICCGAEVDYDEEVKALSGPSR